MRRVVVTGAAGFLGSNLCRALLQRGDRVVGVDNFLTGSPENLSDILDDIEFHELDVAAGLPITGAIDAILHFASPASPPRYLEHPVETLEVNSVGTRHALDLAAASNARFLLASTSEVYGDPLVTPQHETYWGNVNPIGTRSCYDEAKRFAEALTMAMHRTRAVNTAIVRIFNTYGPRLQAGDGRVVSNFLMQALREQPLTVYGDGSQTRSYCYVDDEVRGILALLDSELHEPVNIGNPSEFTVLELAELVIEVTGSSSPITFEELPDDDPMQRRPDITRAGELLDWTPEVDLVQGLELLRDWYIEQM
jgi:nucleoside-diphosphate-sugar epimerase